MTTRLCYQEPCSCCSSTSARERKFYLLGERPRPEQLHHVGPLQHLLLQQPPAHLHTQQLSAGRPARRDPHAPGVRPPTCLVYLLAAASEQVQGARMRGADEPPHHQLNEHG